MHATTWMKLENMLSEKSQTQMPHAEWFHFFMNVQTDKDQWLLGACRVKSKEWLLVDTELLWGLMKMFQN